MNNAIHEYAIFKQLADNYTETKLKEIHMENNNVNHPAHYGRENAMECIDEMELIFGTEAVKHFCICNAWKYRYRAADKNGEEDIAKSDWYMNKYRELLEKKEKATVSYSIGGCWQSK